jgi:hypothetical protein
MDLLVNYGIRASLGGLAFEANGSSERYNFTFVDNRYVITTTGAVGTDLTDYAITDPLMPIANNSIIFSNPEVVHEIYFYASGSFLGFQTLNDVNASSGANYLGDWNGTIPANATHFRLSVHKIGFTGTYPIPFKDFIAALVGYETTTTSTYSSGGKNYKVHTFKANGTFVVSGSGLVDYLIIGGGGGNDSQNGGGGGAGGFREFLQIQLTNGTYSVVVGAGGVNALSSFTNKGGNSSFNNHVSAGGGSGGRYRQNNAQSGGSGGGGGAAESGFAFPSGGVGNTPAVTPSQGNNGGNGILANNLFAGGGGGAGGPGANAASNKGGNGGIGKQSSITGTAVYYAGGGGGSVYTGTPGTGGLGGGGIGAYYFGADGTPGTNGLGGGAGAGGDTGGSGVVIIRYEIQ